MFMVYKLWLIIYRLCSLRTADIRTRVAAASSRPGNCSRVNTMSHNSQAFLPTNAGLSPSYETSKAMRQAKRSTGLTELGEPHNSAVVRTTVINMPREVSVPDPVVWSLFNTFFFNSCCLGFIASAYSAKSRDRKMVDDLIGAQAYTSTATCLDISSLIFSILVVVLSITMSPITSSSPFHKERHILGSSCPLFHSPHLALPLG
uniref:Uncharacterized protein n=1 Tax=Rattus norvegicus TaxID=10116 RepID=A0ABK0LJJ6_RAT